MEGQRVQMDRSEATMMQAATVKTVKGGGRAARQAVAARSEEATTARQHAAYTAHADHAAHAQTRRIDNSGRDGHLWFEAPSHPSLRVQPSVFDQLKDEQAAAAA